VQRHLRHPDTAHTLKELCECCGLFGHDLVVREELAVSYTHALVEPHRSVRRSLVRRCRHRRQDRHEAVSDDLRVARLSAHQGGREALAPKADRPMLTRYAPGVRLRTTKEPSSFVTALSAVPTSRTTACVTGAPAESVTRPPNAAPPVGVVSVDRDRVSGGARPRPLSLAACPYADAAAGVAIHAAISTVFVARCHRGEATGLPRPDRCAGARLATERLGSHGAHHSTPTSTSRALHCAHPRMSPPVDVPTHRVCRPRRRGCWS